MPLIAVASSSQTGFPLINYLPRFMLSSLLVFSSVGFLIENLFDTRKKFNKVNFASIWGIFLVNVVAGEIVPSLGLLIAIAAGLIWGLIAFAVHFARKSASRAQARAALISGEVHCSTAIRSAAQEAKLGVLGVWYTIVVAQGYIFFGTAARLHRIVKGHVASMKRRPRAERTKTLIFNLSDVYGVDASASVIFLKSYRLVRSQGITLVWAGLSRTVETALTRSGVLGEDALTFPTLDMAEKWVEDRLLERVHSLALRWLLDKACRDIYNRAMVHDALTTTHSNTDGIAPSQLLKWSARSFVPKGQIILVEGHDDDGLYLLYRGLVQVDETVAREAHTVYPGAFFNEHVLYSPRETGALFTASAAEDCVILRMGHEQRLRMQHHAPHHAYQLLLSVFKQVEMRSPTRRHHTWLEQSDLDGLHKKPSAAGAAVDDGEDSPTGAHYGAAAGEEAHEGEPWKGALTLMWKAEGELTRHVAGAEGDGGTGGEAAAPSVPSSTSPPSSPSKSPSKLSVSAEGRASRGEDAEMGAARSPQRHRVGFEMRDSAGDELAEPSGVQRRKTTKGQDAAKRITDRDKSIKNLLAKALSSPTLEAVPAAAVVSTTSGEGGECGGCGGGGRGRSDSAASDTSQTSHASDGRRSAPDGGKARGPRSSVRALSWWVKDGAHGGTTNEASGGGYGIARKARKESAAQRAPPGGATADVDADRRTVEDFEVTDGGMVVGRGRAVEMQRPRSESDEHARWSEGSMDLDDELDTAPTDGARHSAPPTATLHIDPESHRHIGHDHYHRHVDIIDAEFLNQASYKVALTTAQREHYTLIFELNDHDDSKHLKVSELAAFMDSLGHGVPVTELEAMLADLNIDEDADGCIELDGFLEFMRRTMVADLPKAKMGAIRTSFERTAKQTSRTEVPASTLARRGRYDGAAGGGEMAAAQTDQMDVVTLQQATEMLVGLGFLLDDLSMEEVFDEVDGDGDGCITYEEFVTCIGMLKRNLLEVHTLEASFTRFRQAAGKSKRRMEKESAASRASPATSAAGGPGAAGATSPPEVAIEGEEEEEDHHVYASDLVAALGVTEEEAEEMIFIADLKDNERIDFTEWKQVVVNWSG